MPNISQSGRQGQLITPLGDDILALVGFDGVEGLSELFEYRIEALSEKEDIDFDRALGRNCALKFKSPNGPDRYFNGVLVEARAMGAREDLFVYQLILRPWLWLLSRTSDCRIWHETNALEIIKDVFRDRGFTDFMFATTMSCPKLEYCVQYRENDLDFVSRLMEQHGIYYFFKHTVERHILLLADAKSSHQPIPGRAEINYFPRAQVRRDQEHFYKWSAERRFRTGKYELNDYDFKKPGKDLTTRKQANSAYRKGSMEIYDHPGKYVESPDGEYYADIRLKADQAQDRRRYAEGDAISVFPGGLTKVDRLALALENIEYLVVRASHSFVQQFYRSRGGGGEADYSGAYELLDANVPFKAPLVTPKPRICGPQTARVVGKEGEEIDVDEYGRILVLFHWDRKKKKSCRLRVAQLWSGKQWGGQFIPRIGMEVVVEFLEGDPDRPLVVGTVYNGDNKFPYALPENKTQSGLKSDSSVGHSGYNQFMFEDKKNAEKIAMRAQKDLETVVLDKETRRIGEAFMGGGASRSTTLVNGGEELTIEMGDQTTTLNAGSQTTTLNAGSQTITLMLGNQQVSLLMGDQTTNLATGNQTTSLAAGNQTTLINGNQTTLSTMNIIITALQSIELVCGASVISMTPLSITIASPTTVIA